MTESGRKTSLATLAILIVLLCLGGVTGLALLAVQFTRWDAATGVLATLLALFSTAVIWVILDAADRWIDRAQSRSHGGVVTLPSAADAGRRRRHDG